MKIVQTVLATAALIAPLLVVDAPAQALTAHQYKAQGHGCYTSSKGRNYRCTRMYPRYGRHHYPHHWRHGYHAM